MTGVKASDMLGKGDYEYALPFYGRRRPILVDLYLDTLKRLKSSIILSKRGGCPSNGSRCPFKGEPHVLWARRVPV